MLRGGEMLLDVAHNVPAVTALADAVKKSFPGHPTALIFGANRDKDTSGMARALLATLGSQLRAAVAVAALHPKATPVDMITQITHSWCGEARAKSDGGIGFGLYWSTAHSMGEALALALAALPIGGRRPLVLCCGSLFVAAEMREHLATQNPALFARTDWVFEEVCESRLQ